MALPRRTRRRAGAGGRPAGAAHERRAPAVHVVRGPVRRCPRVALVLVFLFSDYLGRAYETNVWPVIGFFLMPTTTLAYAWAVNTNGTVTGVYLVGVVVAVLIDPCGVRR